MNENTNSNPDEFIFTIEEIATDKTIAVHVLGGNKNSQKFYQHQTNGISKFIKALDETAKNMLKEGATPESIKLHIQHNIEQLLFAASKKTNGIINEQDKSSKEVRTAIWTMIRQYISKDDLLFVGEERPQAWQGKNWLVKWNKPQEKVNKRMLSPRRSD